MSKAYEYRLTERDDNVPNGYIKLWDIFSDTRYALPGYDRDKWRIGSKQLKRMRYMTYRSTLKRVQLCNAPNFDKFWNGNLDAINSIGINEFAKVLSFRELSTAMICFQSVEITPDTKEKRKMIGWGIKKDIYWGYYESLKTALLTGNEPEKVSMYDQRKRRDGNVFKLKDEKIGFDMPDGSKQIVTVKKNALFNQFEFWCKANRVSKRDGIYQAIAELMENNPVENMKEIGAYERRCDLESVEVLIPEISIEDEVSSYIHIPKKTHTKMREIIERYNADVENSGKQRMTTVAYIVQAIALLNEKAPLKYSNPEAYKEYVKAKEAEKYNRIMSGN